MKRGDTAITELLQVGDRFYFSNDKKKEVWEVRDQKRKYIKYGTLTTIIFKVGTVNFIKHVMGNRSIVFLRNINDKTEA